jgi:hypothetical protein
LGVDLDGPQAAGRGCKDGDDDHGLSHWLGFDFEGESHYQGERQEGERKKRAQRRVLVEMLA